MDDEGRASRRSNLRAHLLHQLRADPERARRAASGDRRDRVGLPRNRRRGLRMLRVLKIGGSVLRDDASYAATAEFLRCRLAERGDERLVVIVSAQYGA